MRCLFVTTAALALLLPAKDSKAWVPPLTSSSSSSSPINTKVKTTTTTRLQNNMFDWLNPNSKAKNAKSRTTTQPKSNVEDFLANWFQVKAPPKDENVVSFRTKAQVEQAEQAIQHELSDVYTKASIPGNLYISSSSSGAAKEEHDFPPFDKRTSSMMRSSSPTKGEAAAHHHTPLPIIQARDAIQQELLSLYEEASIPGHLYDTSRVNGNNNHNHKSTTAAEVEEAEQAISNELSSIYEEASVPKHLYDHDRMTAKGRMEEKQQAAATASAASANVRKVEPAAAKKSGTAAHHQVHPTNPYNRFLEQAEDAIEHELSSVYADASIPQHMYEEHRVRKEGEEKDAKFGKEEEEQDARYGRLISDSTIHTGIVQWFDPKKGYGFIEPTEDGETEAVFVHHSGIYCEDNHGRGYYRKLIPHETVEYQISYDKYGRTRATHVTGPHGNPVKSILQQQLDRDD